VVVIRWKIQRAVTGGMMTITEQKRHYDYRRIHVFLQREVRLTNHKRICRLYGNAGSETSDDGPRGT
jgi:hypothetical protein